MHIFHTVPYTFSKVLTSRRICLTSRVPLAGDHFSFILATFMFDSLVILYGEIRCLSLFEVKGFEERMTMLVLYEATAKNCPESFSLGTKA